MHDPAVVARGASDLDGARVAGGGVASVDDNLLAILGGLPREGMVLRAATLVPRGVIGKVRLREEPRSPRSPIGERDVGPDAGVLQRDDVLGRAVGRVSGLSQNERF